MLPLLPLQHASTEPIRGRGTVPPVCINSVQNERHIHVYETQYNIFIHIKIKKINLKIKQFFL